MTAATRAPRYFVLVVGGVPLTHHDTPGVPVIFREEHEALAASRSLQTADHPREIILEAYADDYSFVGSRSLEGPSGLTLRPAGS